MKVRKKVIWNRSVKTGYEEVLPLYDLTTRIW